MEIAKVEPLTTARALRGPFDYRLPEAMQRRRRRIAARGARSARADPRRRRRPRAETRRAAGAARRADRGARGGRDARSSSGSGSGSPSATARPRRAAWRWSCRRARGPAPAVAPRCCGRGPSAGRRSPRRAARRSARVGRPRLGERQRAALELLATGGERSASALAEAGADSVVLAPARGARPRSSATSARCGGGRVIDAGRRRAASGVRALGRAARLRRRRDRLARRATARASGCCTASPDRARPRSTWRRSRRRSERGRGAILLVPEIGLTPQTLGRVAARLGDTVAVLHSGLSEGERFDEWRRLRSGEARVCVGPRSAVFAPIGGPRPDRRRRGARLLLQAGGRPPLRRPRRRPPPRRGRRRRLPGRDRDAAAGELGRARPPRAPRAGRRPPAAAGRGARHARGRPPRPGPCTQRRARRSAAWATAARRS